MENLLLPPLLQVLFDKMASPVLDNLDDILNSTNNLVELKETLEEVRAILESAEEKEVAAIHVRIWLSKLKRATYSAQYLLDNFGDGVSRYKNMYMVKSKLFELHNIKEEWYNWMEGSKFSWMESRKIMDHINKETSSFVMESEVYGREGDKEKIVKLLLSTTAEGGRVSCISIVGLGGLGKTTVAQLVFNDQRAKNHFDVKTWVFVSDHFDAKNILMAVIESVSEKKSSQSTMEGLHSEVRRLLHKKRYLIVLDDVWTDDQENWDKLKPLFGGVVGGSKIIITTRSQRVSNMMNSPTFPYILEGLTEDACWSLFQQRAFRPGEEKKHPDLLSIGREIVKKCGGVPLAAKTLGSLMLLKRERREWLAVQDSELWNLDKSENGILPALKLSYHHLPCRLKRCFSFCSIIPRGYEINKEKLIHQWMAADLLQFGLEEETPEDIGNDYFNYLLWISFFQEVKNCDVYGSRVGYKMHDLIYDLAQSLAGIDSVIMNHGFSPKICSKVLHSSVVCNSRALSMIPEALYKSKNLRTLHLFANGDFAEVPSKVFSSFKCLRELDLSGCGLVVLDGSIGEHLLSLRYLNLSHTHIKELPCSIEKLCYLQTLNVSGCYNLVALPNIANMPSLRHLNTSGCDSLTTMLPLVEPFASLQQNLSPIMINAALPKRGNQLRTLPLFVVGSIIDLLLLGRLHLHGNLKITHLNKVHSELELHVLEDLNFNHIESLKLYWGDDKETAVTRFQERKDNYSYGRPQLFQHNDHDHDVASRILSFLYPGQNLKRLEVQEFPGHFFPYWINHVNLTDLKLVDCRNCKNLPALGNLMLLNSLLLQGIHAVISIGKDFYSKKRPFAELRELAIIDFPNLEEWLSPDGEESLFPSLEKLPVSKCPKLKLMPKIMSDIQHLELRDCSAIFVHSFQNLTSLKVLVIENVQDLSSFTGEFPANNTFLTSLEIKSCRDLHSLPTLGGLTSLKSLTIRWCRKLSYLPEGLENLNTMDSFEIGDCHSLMFLPKIGTSGFSKLRTLSIESCSNLTSISMGLHNLTSLEHLIIMFCPSLSFPDHFEHLVALQSLTILGCSPEFKSLPEELQSLPGLLSLEIRSCPGLEALPDWIGKLISLRSLAISNCPITSLPESIKQLSGLQHLSIQHCPSLLGRCASSDGEDWPKLSHIPYKKIGQPKPLHPTEASSSSS